MKDIAKLREQINNVDEKIAALFEERMHIAGEIAQYKKETGMPVFDEEREKAVIEKNSKLIKDETLKDYYVSFIKKVMDISKEYQTERLK